MCQNEFYNWPDCLAVNDCCCPSDRSIHRCLACGRSVVGRSVGRDPLTAASYVQGATSSKVRLFNLSPTTKAAGLTLTVATANEKGTETAGAAAVGRSENASLLRCHFHSY
jgi:hypothetical protein